MEKGTLPKQARFAKDTPTKAVTGSSAPAAKARDDESSQDTLRRWQDLFRNAFDQAAIGMALVGLGGNWLRVNPALSRIVGYSVQELLATNFQSITHSEDLETDLNYVDQMLRGEIRSYKKEKRYVHKEGHTVWILLNVSMVYDRKNNPLFLFEQIQDITQRKQTEEALRQSEDSYRRLVELSPEAMWVHDERAVIFANDACAKLFGASSVDELLGKPVLDFQHPDDREAVRQRMQRHFEGQSLIRAETRLIRLDGKEAYVEVVACNFMYQGKPAAQVTFRDIEERKRAEEKLRKSEAKLAAAQRIAHLGSFEQDLSNLDDLEKDPLYWSDEVFRIFGYEPDGIAVSRANFMLAVHPEDRDRVQGAVARMLQNRSSCDLDYRIIRPDATERIIHAQTNVICDEVTGRPLRLVGTVQDITEQRQLENQYRQAQKMEAVGRLAGGIAHDFNNLLTVIKGNSDILADLGQQHEPYQRSVKQIRKAADQAASLTRQLLAFSRMQVLQPKVLDVNSVVAEMEKMLPRLIGEDIEFIFVPDKAIGRIKADSGQIEQVIVNLVVNARDAMPHGGKLIIETRDILLDDDYARRHPPTLVGEYVMLSVSDTGHGMDAETQSHIFEPFFTTKEQGKGTGLGLATVYGIVKQSGGFIWAYSEQGIGTAFKIYFPRVDEPVEIVQPSRHTVADVRGTETVLLAEDEEDLRGLMGDFLRERGYTVLEAKNGAEGLEIAANHGAMIHLLVTDVVMPQMGGWDLAERMVALRPDLKVLYLSGYSEYAAAPRDSRIWRDAFVQKPFAMELLARKVRDVLGTSTVLSTTGTAWQKEGTVPAQVGQPK